MVASAILIVLVLAATYLMTTLAAVKSEIGLSGVQNALASDIRKHLSSRAVFIQTLQALEGGLRKNPSFYSCSCGIGACRSLQTPFPALIAHESQTGIVSPKSFNGDGNACDPATQQCAFTLRTDFFAECGPDFAALRQDPSVECNGRPAEFIAVRYTIEPSASAMQITRGNLRAVSGWIFLDINRMKPTAAECM